MVESLLAVAQIFRISDHYLRPSLTGLDEQALRQRVGGANSIHWIAGHVAVGRRRLLCLLGKPGPVLWADIFGKGSAETPQAEFPPLCEILKTWDADGGDLQNCLSALRFEELVAPAPLDLPGSEKTVGGWITYLAYHEAYHIGQISQLRKALGKGLKRRTAEILIRAESKFKH
jgi:hypothetical protein